MTSSPLAAALPTTSLTKVMEDPQSRIREPRPQSSPCSHPASIQFQIKYGEKMYGGRYLFDDGELWVASNWGNKVTAAHVLTADSLARVLLREIVDEAKVRGELA